MGLKKDSMKSSVRKNHLGSNLVVAGELNETCLWPTSKEGTDVNVFSSDKYVKGGEFVPFWS